MATWASDGSLPSVQALHDQVATVNGDTITIPAGTFTWTGGPVHNNNALQITKAITLQGAGSPNTIVQDGGTGVRFMYVSLVAGQLTRITGIHWKNGGRNGGPQAPTGLTHIDGSNTNGAQFRYDHNIYDQLQGVFVMDTVIGVMDHNVWNYIADTIFYIYGSNWNDQGPYGDGSWFAPVVFGSSQFTFFENETFNNTLGSGNGIIFDAVGGGRFCIRYCTFNDARISDHGTESDGRGRGNRAIECYNNTFNGTTSGGLPIGGTRSAHSIVWGNTSTNSNQTKVWILNDYRTDSQFPVNHNNLAFGGASGINRWDLNDTTGGPSGNGIYWSGTAATNAGPGAVHFGQATVTVSGIALPNFGSYQYTVVNKSIAVPPPTNMAINQQNYSQIVSNTTNTITFRSGDYEAGVSFAIGDLIEVHKLLRTIDQPGRGQGSLIDPTLPQPDPPAGWNNQVDEIAYAWNNTPAILFQIGSAGFGFPTILPGVHFLNNNTPLPGYTPFTYPHPLVAGGSTGKIISLSGTGLAFGNVTIGNSATGTLMVSNTGDTVLTVSLISYPAGFSGATTGFTVAPGATVNITVTFTPVSAITYSGNINVTSDATSGVGSIAVSGTGINPVVPPARHKKRQRDAYGTGM